MPLRTGGPASSNDLEKDAGDAGVDERGQEAGEQAARPEAGEVAAPGRGHGADAADLDADGREVREASQREGGEDVARARSSRPCTRR